MSSDTRFPDLQRSSIWSRLKQVLTLDGGGDWEHALNVTTWICPKGLYEVYAKMDTGSSILVLNAVNQLVRISLVGIWYPCVMQYVVTEFVISGEIGTPGLGDTLLTMTQSVQRENASTCPQGWTLSSGDILTLSAAGTFDVRYRRIG